MQREQFEHILRAAGDVLQEQEVIVVGSQAILGSIADPPPAAARSIEVDILPIEDADQSKADQVDGAIGEASWFQETHGVYAQGVGLETARLPDGWRDRLVPFCNENTNGVTGLCLEPHDLVVCKLLAGRTKDLDFSKELLSAQLVKRAVLEERLGEVPNLTAQERATVLGFLERIAR
jgi:hypothetical protein